MFALDSTAHGLVDPTRTTAVLFCALSATLFFLFFILLDDHNPRAFAFFFGLVRAAYRGHLDALAGAAPTYFVLAVLGASLGLIASIVRYRRPICSTFTVVTAGPFVGMVLIYWVYSFPLLLLRSVITAPTTGNWKGGAPWGGPHCLRSSLICGEILLEPFSPPVPGVASGGWVCSLASMQCRFPSVLCANTDAAIGAVLVFDTASAASQAGQLHAEDYLRIERSMHLPDTGMYFRPVGSGLSVRCRVSPSRRRQR